MSSRRDAERWELGTPALLDNDKLKPLFIFPDSTAEIVKFRKLLSGYTSSIKCQLNLFTRLKFYF
jgi:hypothetical protein